MNKNFKRLGVVVNAILLVTLLSASVVFAEVQDIGEYVEVQVTVQIFDMQTGDMVSYEDFHVTLSHEEFESNGAEVIQPRIPIRRQINFPFAYPSMQNVASARSSLGSSYTLRIENEGWGNDLSRVRFEVLTQSFNTLLGSGSLGHMQFASVTITGPTLEYRVMMGRSHGATGGTSTMIGIFTR
jgi:hypothetical protein